MRQQFTGVLDADLMVNSGLKVLALHMLGSRIDVK